MLKKLRYITCESHFSRAAISGQRLSEWWSTLWNLNSWGVGESGVKDQSGLLETWSQQQKTSGVKTECKLCKSPFGFIAQGPTYTTARLLHQFYFAYFSNFILAEQFNSQSCSTLFMEKGGTVSRAGIGTGNLSSTAVECQKQFQREVYSYHVTQAPGRINCSSDNWHY